MDCVLAGLQWWSCLVYIDDIIIIGRSFEDHLRTPPSISFRYGTDLMQRRTCTRVLGHHSPSARTPSSVSFNGLELELEKI